MAAVNLSLPGKSMQDSSEAAQIKSYLRVLVSELEYLLTHLGADNMAGGSIGQADSEQSVRITALEKTAAREKIQYGTVEITASEPTTGSVTVTLSRAYTGTDAYIALAQVEKETAGAWRAAAERVSGQSIKINYAADSAGIFRVVWLTVGK